VDAPIADDYYEGPTYDDDYIAEPQPTHGT
jgi:hypothetical protein